jgi:hypothetical protein
MLFSAPAGNRFTPAGYNTTILVKLLRQWRQHIADSTGVAVNVKVALTDSDVKERSALVTVWPDVELLLCTRHLRECWKHHKNQVGSLTSVLTRLMATADASSLLERHEGFDEPTTVGAARTVRRRRKLLPRRRRRL